MDAALRLAERVQVWLVAEWPEALVSLPDLYQLGPNPVRSQKTAREVVAILEDHDLLVREPGPAVVRGQRRREVWRIIGKVGA